MGLIERWRALSRGKKFAVGAFQAFVMLLCLGIGGAGIAQPDLPWATTLLAVGVPLVVLELLFALIVRNNTKGYESPARASTSRRDSEKMNAFHKLIAAVVWLWMLYMAAGYVANWLFPESERATRWRYGLEKGLEDANYDFSKRPHDCEFLTAPLGDKHCHYDRHVQTIRIRETSSGRWGSVDEGKSWSRAESSDKPLVYVSWTRVEE